MLLQHALAFVVLCTLLLSPGYALAAILAQVSLVQPLDTQRNPSRNPPPSIELPDHHRNNLHHNSLDNTRANGLNSMQTNGHIKNSAAAASTHLQPRSLADCALSTILLVADVDGALHAVDRATGLIRWTLPIDSPLVKIETNSSSTDQNVRWFVEPVHDGSLFYFTPTYGLNKLPASIRSLVDELPFSIVGDDKVYTGSRKTALYSVNLLTGQLLSRFGDNICPVSATPEQTAGPASTNSSPIDSPSILIGRTTYELSIYSQLNSLVVWNVTYSLWGPNNINQDLALQNVDSLDDTYFTPFHDRSLLALSKNQGSPLWVARLPLLAVSVFDVFQDLSGSLVVLPHPSLADSKSDRSTERYQNLVFLNQTARLDDWFAMSYENFPGLIKSSPVLAFQRAVYAQIVPLPMQILRVGSQDEEVANALRGIHEVHHLDDKSQYQPHLVWETGPKRIGGGPEPQPTELILLPTKREVIRYDKLQLDVSLIDQLLKFHRPQPEPQFYEQEDTTINMTLNLVLRICEHIIVILVLLVLLSSFGRFSGFWKRFVGTNTTSNNTTDSESPSIYKEVRIDPKSYEKDLPEIPGNLVKPGSEESFPESEETISSEKNVEQHNKKNQQNDEDIDQNNKPTDQIEKTTEQNDKITEFKTPDETESKKKRKRGSRGARRSNKKKTDDEQEEDETVEDTDVSTTTKTTLLIPKRPAPPLKRLQIENNLVLSDKILGYGSHGTVVFEGTFENRPVAVKRMLLDFYDVASHEVRLLQESDDHPNVVRYFCSQLSESEKFLYIALELCLCLLEDVVEKPALLPGLKFGQMTDVDPIVNEVLLQLASGLNYLHLLKIVHRDLKPQNILVADYRKSKVMGSSTKGNDKENIQVRLLISDFGLCKKLDTDQSSFRATTQHAASGTSGWRAPELLLHGDTFEISVDTINSQHSNAGSTSNGSNGSGDGSGGKRLTKAIDIFSLGCVYYYILTGGSHPFGDRYLREANIIKGIYNLSQLSKSCPLDYVELKDLILLMIAHNPLERPNTKQILKHPFFWSVEKKLDFLLKVSDRFEVERRDPPSELLLKLEEVSEKVHQMDWHAKMEADFMENLGKYRKYHTTKLMDLLRALRNKYHHYNDMPPGLQKKLSPLPHGFYRYFNDRFPNLLMEIYFVVQENLKEEHLFSGYF